MSDKFKQDFSIMALDPVLLSTPYKVQTNWQVITGSPSSGKSTIINQLNERGFKTIPETGRLYVEREISKGRTIDDIRRNMADAQITIKNLQLEIEKNLSAKDVIFLDGALPGSLAWFRAYGLDPNNLLPECFHHRYASVFIFDPLDFQEDGARNGDSRIVGFLDKWLESDYKSLGYQVLRVPVLSIQERFNFILERVEKSR